jgi:hypothetical protein
MKVNKLTVTATVIARLLQECLPCFNHFIYRLISSVVCVRYKYL